MTNLAICGTLVLVKIDTGAADGCRALCAYVMLYYSLVLEDSVRTEPSDHTRRPAVHRSLLFECHLCVVYEIGALGGI